MLDVRGAWIGAVAGALLGACGGAEAEASAVVPAQGPVDTRAAPSPRASVPQPVVLPRQRMLRRSVDPGFAVLRLRGQEDAATLGFAPSVRTAVIALEHPMVTPPELTRQTLGDRDVLVLSWLARPPNMTLTAEADYTWAWALEDDVAVLVVRVVDRADRLAEQVATPTDDGEIPGRSTTITTPTGPDVSLDPAYWRVGPWLFPGRYEVAAPTGVDGDAAVAVVRATASGRRARLIAGRILQDGVRVELALPVDRGPMPWGPRAGSELDVLLVPVPSRRVEWLLRLE